MLLPPDTDVLVVANPGTGKTWEIADTVIGLLKTGVPGQRIACLTFTNRAAREMFDRILKMAAGDPVLLEAIYLMDIGTMHSLAFRMDEGSTPDNNCIISCNSSVQHISKCINCSAFRLISSNYRNLV